MLECRGTLVLWHFGTSEPAHGQRVTGMVQSRIQWSGQTFGVLRTRVTTVTVESAFVASGWDGFHPLGSTTCREIKLCITGLVNNRVGVLCMWKSAILTQTAKRSNGAHQSVCFKTSKGQARRAELIQCNRCSDQPLLGAIWQFVDGLHSAVHHYDVTSAPMRKSESRRSIIIQGC